MRLDRWMSAMLSNLVHNFLNIPCENLRQWSTVINGWKINNKYTAKIKMKKMPSSFHSPFFFCKHPKFTPSRSDTSNFAFQSANNARHRRHRSMHIDAGSINIYIFVAREISIHGRRFNPSHYQEYLSNQLQPLLNPPFLLFFFFETVSTLFFFHFFISSRWKFFEFFVSSRSARFHRHRSPICPSPLIPPIPSMRLNRLLRVDWTTARQETE